MSFDFAALKQGFFDSAKVKAGVDAGLRRVLSKLGSFVRRRARSSIRKRKRAAAAGSPPSSHAGQLKLIYFAWDAAQKSVVVGPIPQQGEAVVPALMEKGGQFTLVEKTKTRILHYRPHPFMKPALDAELPGFAAQLKGLMN